MQSRSGRHPKTKGLNDAQLRAVFRVFDDDCSGDISKKEFRDVSMKRRGQIAIDELEQIADDADVDGSGTVDYEAFKQHYHQSFR